MINRLLRRLPDQQCEAQQRGEKRKRLSSRRFRRSAPRDYGPVIRKRQPVLGGFLPVEHLAADIFRVLQRFRLLKCNQRKSGHRLDYRGIGLVDFAWRVQVDL